MLDWDELPLGERIRQRTIARATRLRLGAMLSEQGRRFEELSRQEWDALLGEAARAAAAECEARWKAQRRRGK